MLVHAGKYRTEEKLKIQTIQKLNTTQKKQIRRRYLFASKTRQSKRTKHTYPGLVTFYDIQPGNEVSLSYNAPKPTPVKLVHLVGYNSVADIIGLSSFV